MCERKIRVQTAKLNFFYIIRNNYVPFNSPFKYIFLLSQSHVLFISKPIIVPAVLTYCFNSLYLASDMWPHAQVDQLT